MDVSIAQSSKPYPLSLFPYPLYDEIKEVSLFICQKGWGERNAGNISVRLQKPDLRPQIFEILISNSGSKFRELAKDPEKHCCVVQSNHSEFRIPQSAFPSSEFPTHSLIHQYLSQHRPSKKCIIHTHPTHLIAFSHKFYDKSPKELNTLLESIMPEVAMYIQRICPPNDNGVGAHTLCLPHDKGVGGGRGGVGFVNLLPPGSDELAQATLAELTHHDVIIWKKHGCIAVGETLWDAVDMIDILDKAAYIALLINT